MTVAEAIKILSSMPLDADILVHDGLDPSDWDIAETIEVDTFYPSGDVRQGRPGVFIK